MGIPDHHHRTNDDEDAAEVSVRLELLDAQVVDADGLPVGRVNDVAVTLPTPPALERASDARTPAIEALLMDQESLGARIGGLTGRVLAETGRQLRNGRPPALVRPGDVADWSGLISLRGRLGEQDLAPGEQWLASHVVSRIPGADNEGL